MRSSPHDAIDFGPASPGDGVIASADGVVLSVRFHADSGFEVVISHDRYGLDAPSRGSPYRTAYSHLRRVGVQQGQRISRGQALGEVGLFPLSGGIVHVHWRLLGPDGALDPMTRSKGCFSEHTTYSEKLLELTFPLRC